MQKIDFTKMHGCGNDYIYVNCFAQEINNPQAYTVRLANRHMGIGGDGMILICPSDVADAKMRMYNYDGTEGKMCGNGIRCVAEYMFTHDLAKGNVVHIETLSGIKEIVRVAPGLLRVDMGAPILTPSQVPVLGFSDEKPVVKQLAEINGAAVGITCVSMGNPHCIVFVDDVEHYNVAAVGPAFEHNSIFPEGVNTEFVEVVDATHLKMRVWERGTGETLACGTGTCATVVAATLCGICPKDTDVDVQLLGGTLTIRYTDETVYMTGMAVEVFNGTIEI